MSSWQEKVRPWLGRLAFSFVIIAVVLAWEGYKALQNPALPGRTIRVVLCFIGAGACAALAGAGMRYRHGRGY
jgi:hypothetical protein